MPSWPASGLSLTMKYMAMGGFGYLLERNRLRVIRGTDGIADMDIRNTGDGNDGTNTRLLHLHSLKTVKLIELSYLDLLKLIRLMMVYQNTFLVHLKSPVVHTSDADTANELIVVNGAYEAPGSPRPDLPPVPGYGL